jgi:hypothetical protein
MATPLDPVTQQIQHLVWSVLLPAIILGAVGGIVFNASIKWGVKKIVEIVRNPRGAEVAVQEDLILDAPPCCPRCRKPMVKRVAKKGLKRDSGFWGCSAFPGCRGTREMA